ncbi:hypothetical protein LIER_30233 [Lithospermum erythrorhizon]|uniref:Uncharacterized protein n=1 Tax=Lithospermum erythrorhizon TaxID=34254 RepID=A0AAV3RMZ3_LITER
MLKRIAGHILTFIYNPSKKAKKIVPPKKSSKVLARDYEEEETHSQGVGSKVGPMTHQTALLTIVVDLASSDMLSDPSADHRDNLKEGRVFSPSLLPQLLSFTAPW